MKVYVASSWRNEYQPDVVAALTGAGHDVYDFRHPAPGNEGFHWTSVQPAPSPWTGEMLREALIHPIAVEGFNADMDALRGCDACVLVLPCGRSAHMELGWAVGAKKFTVALMLGPDEPELMYRMLDQVCTTIEEVVEVLTWAGRMGFART